MDLVLIFIVVFLNNKINRTPDAGSAITKQDLSLFIYFEFKIGNNFTAATI